MYGRLKGLGFGLAQVNDIYTGFNVIARESRTSSEDAAGAFLQLSQAMGSGKLQGDELRSILERMPQLAQAIAQEMGVSAGSIRQLAADGKIGVEQLANTLYGAAGRADQLGQTFTTQQATMAQVRQRWEEVSVAIGEALAPTYLTALNALADAAFFFGEVMKGAAVWVEKNRSAIEGVVKAGIEIGKLVGSVWLVVAAYQAWQKVTVALAAAKAFLVGLSGKGLILVAGAAAAAAGAYALLSKGVDETGKAIERMKGESEKAFQARKAQIESELTAQRAIEDQLTKQRQAQEELVQSEKDLQKQRDKALNALQEQASLSQGLLQAQIELAKAKGQTAEAAKLEAALAKQVYTDTVAQIQLELQQGRITAEVANQKKQIAETTYKAAQASQQLANATQGVAQQTSQVQTNLQGALGAIQKNIELTRVWEDGYQALLNNQKMMGANAGTQLNTMREIAHLQKQRIDNERAIAQATHGTTTLMGRVAEFTAKAKTEAIDLKLRMAEAKVNAGGYADEMARGADATERAANAAKGIAPALAQFGEAGKNSEFANAWYEAMKGLNEKTLTAAASQRKYNETMAQFLKMAERYNQLKAQEKRSSAQDEWGKITGGRLPGYASGGYVTGPQVAMIGEGGQSEYVIPSSKMASAMANYAAGKRGSAVLSTPQVNITTGPVTQMDGTNYVTQGDLMASTQSAVKQTLALLQNNPSVRRSIGVTR
jgi:tape measure domain-containing protein